MRWLALMNAAGLIVYNQKNPTLRVLFNPNELAPVDEEAEGRERSTGHVVSADTPFSNRLALRKVIRDARGWLFWYEQHLPGKVLEVLVGELDGDKLNEVRLLSGPANITADVKADFANFAKEVERKRGIDGQWRILSKADAQARHDRIILSEGLAMNVPPLNTLLMGSASEILPSQIGRADFEAWWSLGTDISVFTVETPRRTARPTTRSSTRSASRRSVAAGAR